jgi:hypothetical protein
MEYHSEDWYKLESKVNQLERELLEANFDISDLKKLLRETVFRCQLALPEDVDSIKWFDEGCDVSKSDFFERIYNELNLGDISDENANNETN